MENDFFKSPFIAMFQIVRLKAPLCKGGCQKSLIFDWGIVKKYRYCVTIPPPRLRRATSLYTREALGCTSNQLLAKSEFEAGTIPSGEGA